MPRALIYLLFGTVLLFSPASILAVDTPSTIEQVIIESKPELEHVQLVFTGAYDDPVSTHFDSGIVGLTLPKADFKESLRDYRVNNRFLKAVHFRREGHNTIVEIQFADSSFQAPGRIKTSMIDNKLNVFINKSAELDNSVSDLGVENPVGDTKQSLPFSDDLLASSNVTVSIVKMLVALAAILLFFYSLLWAYNKFFVRKFSFRKGEHSIKLVSSYHISPKQKIIVLDVDGKSFACGVTSNNINLISEVNDDSFNRFISHLHTDEGKEINFSNLRTQYLESKIAKDNSDSARSTSSFASELLDKVKKLTPID